MCMGDTCALVGGQETRRVVELLALPKAADLPERLLIAGPAAFTPMAGCGAHAAQS